MLALFSFLPAAFARTIIDHNSYALAGDYLKTFKKSQNDATFFFTGSGWEGKVFKMNAPKRILGEFKDKNFRELSFNFDECKEGVENSFEMSVINADCSKIEMRIAVDIDLSKGRFIVLHWDGSDFSMKAYKEKPKNLEAISEQKKP